MKKIIYLLLITVLFTACSKRKDFNLLSINQSCQISKIEFRDASDEQTATFNYDDNGNLVKIEIKPKKGVPKIHTFTYSKPNIVHKRQINDEDIITIYDLDDSGKITAAVRGRPFNATTNAMKKKDATYQYKYTNDGYLSGITQKNSANEFAEEKTYTWQNGNIISIEKKIIFENSSFPPNTHTFPCKYDHEEPYPINFIAEDIFQFGNDEADYFLRKYFGKLPKNLPVSQITVKDGDRVEGTEYAYKKDDNRRVTEVNKVEKYLQKKDESITIKYQYNCNVKQVKKSF